MKSNQLINIFSIAAQSDSIRRYSRDKITNPESVLQHSGWCGLFCVLAADLIESLGEVTIDYGKLLRRAILHDIDECGSGDIPRTTKYATPQVREGMAVVEVMYVKLIENQLQLSENSIMKEWANAKDKATIEGILLKYADLVAVVYKIWDEVIILNNMGFYRVTQEVSQILEDDSFLPEWLVDKYPNTYRWFKELEKSMSHVVQSALHIVNQRSTLLGSIDFTIDPEEVQSHLDEIEKAA